jgi:DNA-directed RNA polymerase specialized sigma24 family protein
MRAPCGQRVQAPLCTPGKVAAQECIRVLRTAHGPHAAGYPLDAETIPDDQAQMAEQQLLAERDTALREAFLHLPPCCQRLIALLIQDPPMPYAEISTKLDIPVGSIGPIRGRCLDRLRRYPAIAALINAEAESAEVNHSGQQ